MSPLVRQFVLLAAAVLLATSSSLQAAQDRFALVIGNSRYKNAPLKNPVNDAELMAETLGGLGFRVTKHTDLNRKQMTRAISEFNRQLTKESVACVFYAGHGLQVDGNNYLVPVDAEITGKWEVRHETIDQHRMIDMLDDSRSSAKLVILDCCLDNPFDRSWRSTRSLSDTRVVPINQAPSGTMILYATGDGQQALDGAGDNSPFSRAVADAFSQRPEGGLLLTTAIAQVGTEMERLLGEDQKPFMRIEPTLLTFKLFGTTEPISFTPTPRPPRKQAASPAPKPEQPLLPPPGAPAIDDSLLGLARAHANAGKHDLAIEAYRAIINNPSQSEDVRRRARLGRGRVYKQRRRADDLALALIDYRAGGQPGIDLVFNTEASELRTGKTVTGTGRRGQIALISTSQQHQGKTLYYVKSVDRDPSVSGWVTADAFSEKAMAKRPAPKSVAASSPRPLSSSGLQSSTRPPTSSSMNPNQFTNSTQPRMSNSTNSSSFRGTGNLSNNSSNRMQSGGSTSSIWQHNNPTKQNNRQKWTQDFQRRTGRLPTVMETPWWENQREMEGNWRARGVNGYGNQRQSTQSRSGNQWNGNTTNNGMTSRGASQGTLRGWQYSGQGNRGNRGRRQGW